MLMFLYKPVFVPSKLAAITSGKIIHWKVKENLLRKIDSMDLISAKMFLLSLHAQPV